MRVKEIHGIVDLDDTCFGWVEWMLKEVGEPPSEEGFVGGRITDMWPNRDPQELLDMVADVRGYADAKPIPEAAKTLQWLLVNFPYIKLSYVSAAPKEAIHARIRAMQNYGFPMVMDHGAVKRIIHTGGHQEKVDWILNYEESIDFLIDDSERYLNAAQIVGVEHRYLLSRPWNLRSVNHRRLLSWAHFRDVIVSDLPSMIGLIP